VATVLRTSSRRFVSTPAIDRLTVRALRYLQSGFSVHLRGPAGTGKTTLSLHLADLLARPMMLMFGDDEAKTSDLIGKQSGYTRKKVVDNYIHSVLKIEDQVRQTWVDSRLTLACREGYTLIYDEFNRSRPEVNNILLSVLEEKLLILPPESNGIEYIKVSPHFRAIFTSNPEEYCGVHSTQDALMDRLITIDVPEPDELTQQEIVIQKTELDRVTASTIVNVVRAFREGTLASTNSGIGASGLRSCLMIGKICKDHEIEATYHNAEFRDLCLDILRSRSPLSVADSTTLIWDILRPESQLMQAPSALRDLVPVVVEPIADLDETLIERPIEEPIEEPIISLIENVIEEPIEDLEDSISNPTFVEPSEQIAEVDLDQTLEQDLDEAFESILEERFESIEQRFESAILSTDVGTEGLLEETLEEPFGEVTSELDFLPSIEEVFEEAVEETIARLDDETMKAVLEEAEESLNASSDADLLLGNETFLALEAELFDMPMDMPALSEVGDENLEATSNIESKVESSFDAGFDAEFDAGFGAGSSAEFDLKTESSVAIEPSPILNGEPESTELTLADQLYIYLKTCDDGARLSQIESDLRLPRSKAVEAIRVLAKTDRLAQRDRRFFALG
jgi:gas vesicle protein GvpN